jgi:hypothetical protein
VKRTFLGRERNEVVCQTAATEAQITSALDTQINGGT